MLLHFREDNFLSPKLLSYMHEAKYLYGMRIEICYPDFGSTAIPRGL